MNFTKKALLIGVGVVTGLVNGLFGGGGGMIVVPLLTILLSLEEKKSHATAIAIILPTTLISAVIQIFYKNYKLSVGLPVGIGVLLGGILGALLLKKINNKNLVKIFAFVMLIAGVKMLFF